MKLQQRREREREIEMFHVSKARGPRERGCFVRRERRKRCCKERDAYSIKRSKVILKPRDPLEREKRTKIPRKREAEAVEYFETENGFYHPAKRIDIYPLLHHLLLKS